MRARTRRWVRWVRNATLVGLGLLGLALVGAHFALRSDAGRQYVRGQLVPLLSDALGGKLAIDHLDALSAFHVRARGVRLLAPSGELLASIAQLDAVLSPWELLSKRVHVTRITLQGVFADLGAPLDEGGGLVGHFAALGRDSEPTADDGGTSIRVILHHIELRSGDVRATLQHEAWHAQKLVLAGSVEVDDEVRVHVASMQAQLVRAGQSIGAVERATGSYGEHSSSLTTSLRLGTSTLALSGRLDPIDSRGAQPVKAWVRGQAIGRETLALLGVQSDWPKTPVDLQLNGNGDTGSLAGVLALDAQEGTLHANTRWAPAKGLRIERLLARSGRAVVDAQGQLDNDGSIHITGGIDAPQLAGSPALAWFISGVSGAANARVELARDATGELSTRLDGRFARLQLDANSVRALHISAQAHGAAIDRLSAHAVVDATDLIAGPARMHSSHLELRGGPQRYALQGRLDARGFVRASLVRSDGDAIIDGAFDVPVVAKPAPLPMPTTAVMSDVNTVAEQAAAGHAPAQGMLRARVRSLKLERSGRIALGRLDVTFQDARVVASGELAPNRQAKLDASVVIPRLSAATALVMSPALHGSLRASVKASGPITAPRVKLDAAYRCPQLQGLREVALDVVVDADLKSRTVKADTALHALGTAVKLASETRLRTLDEKGLREAQHELALDIDRFPLHALDLWPRAPAIPDVAVLSGTVKAQGTLEDYAFQSALRARARFAEGDAPIDAWLDASYQDQKIELSLRASDQLGPLLRTAVKTELAGPRVPLDRASFEQLVVQHGWEVSLWLAARRIDELPATRALGVPESMWPARVSADIKLEHRPGTEPTGSLLTHAVWDPPGIKTPAPLCGLDRSPHFSLDAKMQDGQLKADVVAGSAGRETLAVTLSSHAPLDEWLQVKASRVRPVEISARLDQLELGNVPLVCEQLRGRVSGSAKLSRGLTPAVLVQASLKGQALTFLDAPPIDVTLDAHARDDKVVGNGTVSAKGGRAELYAELPLDGRGLVPSLRVDAPLRIDARFQSVPAAALVASVPSVRASNGTIGGWIGIRDTFAAPALRGRIDLHEVTMTLGELGQRFERANGSITIDGRKLVLSQLRFTDLGGRAKADGELTLHSFDPLAFDARFDIDAKDLPIRRSGVLAAHLDAKINTKIHLEATRTEVLATLRQARIELADAALSEPQSLEENPDIVFSGEPAKATDEGTASALHFRIDARQPFWVRRSDFSALVSTDLTIASNAGSATVVGVIKVQRGTVELLGQLFDVERGTIEFSGGHEIEPTLELAATRKIPGAGGSVVRVEARGPVSDPQLTFQVDGQVATAGDALAAALGTRASPGGDTRVQDEVSSLATGIAGSVLTLGARRELGPWVPVLALERGAGETRLRAGVEADRFIPKFLRKVVVDAYVEGIVTSQEQTENGKVNESKTSPAALLELRFPHDLSTDAQYGPGQRWSLDLGWEP